MFLFNFDTVDCPWKSVHLSGFYTGSLIFGFNRDTIIGSPVESKKILGLGISLIILSSYLLLFLVSSLVMFVTPN